MLFETWLEYDLQFFVTDALPTRLGGQKGAGHGYLRWLTTVFLRHNCARWEILSDAFFFRACNTLRDHREKAENTCEIWLVEIARGVLLTFLSWMDEVLKQLVNATGIKSVKPWQKPQEVVVKILMFIARAILRYFSARLSCTHAQFCSRRRPQKNRKSTFWAQSTRKLTV